jgi:hypothetical protein
MAINWGRSIGWNIDMHRYKKQKMEYTIIENGADCYPWKETFIIWPRRSVSGAPLFFTKAYKRQVWVVWGTGFHMEPTVQYATAFDLLTYDGNYTP